MIIRLATFALIALPAIAAAQQDRVDRWLDDCNHRGWNDNEHVCEVRRYTIDKPGKRVRIDGGQNGGVTVHGWDKPTMLVVAMVQANGRRESDARDVIGEIKVEATDATVRATGPSTSGRRGWAVSYDIYIPRQSNIDVEAENGGISIERVKGRLDLETTNGGIHVTEVAGDVRGQTMNGGVSASLTGATWDGAGLDLRTTNGGVKLEIPRGYNAQLEMGTTNGSMRTDFPITVKGRVGRTISTVLGSGGAVIRAVTTNGGVRLEER